MPHRRLSRVLSSSCAPIRPCCDVMSSHPHKTSSAAIASRIAPSLCSSAQLVAISAGRNLATDSRMPDAIFTNAAGARLKRECRVRSTTSPGGETGVARVIAYGQRRRETDEVTRRRASRIRRGAVKILQAFFRSNGSGVTFCSVSLASTPYVGTTRTAASR